MQIDFIAETHTYLVDGVKVPSVSKILGATLFKDKYSNIPQYILDKAAEHGTLIHKAIEDGETGELNEEQLSIYQDWLDLESKHQIEPMWHEMVVASDMGYIGTLDMIAMVNDTYSLLDVKTTSKLDFDYLSWQLSMYAEAHGDDFKKLYCIWLPKRKYGTPMLAEIQRKTKKDIKALIMLYHDVIQHPDYADILINDFKQYHK